MVAIVVVSHSAVLAEGVVELAREMGGPEVAIAAAGGIDEQGALGTDAERVRAAIESVRSPDGVLVLMDLGSALMSAEFATEMLDPPAGDDVVLCDAPLVEGAVAAAASARIGASLEEVAREARGALAAKQAQLADEEDAQAPEAEAAEQAGPAEEAGGIERTLPVHNRLGLHARPAARFVETVGRFDSTVSVRNATTGRGPANGRSLTSLALLDVRGGHEVLVRASGPQAEQVLDALADLAEQGFGDDDRGAGAGDAVAWAAPAPGAPAAAAGAASVGRVAVPERDVIEVGPPIPPEPGTALQGIGASASSAAGPARHIDPPPLRLPEDRPDDPAAEVRRLDEARAAAREELQAIRDRVARRAGDAEAAIFDAQLALLDDEGLLEPARAAITGEGRNAAQAWAAAAERVADGYRGLETELLRERAVDVLDVGRRVVAHLIGVPMPDAAGGEPAVVVARELTPGQAALLEPGEVVAVATAGGSPTAHAAILVRALGIPAVVGAGGKGLTAVPDGTTLLVDGDAGVVHVDPPPGLLAEHEARRAAREERRRLARAHAHAPARTRDGVHIEVMANVGRVADARQAVEAGADGVGLLRTEFLFLDRATLPDEDEQVAAYREIAEALQGRPLTLRTLDVGADKPLPSLPQPPEANPFLGRRGLRLGLAQPGILRVQLRAALRVAAEFPLRIMFPMVSTPGELREARGLVEEERAALGGPDRIEVGIMVEVPAATLAAATLAAEADFFSIGTNDLTQYVMAAERGNAAVAALGAGLQPAVLRLVAATVDGARRHGRWVGVCGELAGDPESAALLVGAGVTELSMAPALIPEVKQVVRDLDTASAARAAREAMDADDAEAVRRHGAELIAGTDRIRPR